jgi:hypothetical protein
MNLGKTGQSQVSSSGTMLFLLPIVGIVLAILLFIFVVPKGYSQITQKISSYKESRQKEELLTKKLVVLKTVPSDVLDKTPQSIIALPDKNPSLMIISQMKEASLAGNVLVTSIKSVAGSAFDESTDKIELVFALEGDDYQSLLTTLSEFSKRAPMTTIDSTTATDTESKKTAEVHVVAYWSKLPENIPAVTDPLTSFSQEELTVLGRVTGLTAPQFNTLSPQQSVDRENPFN